LAIYGIACTSRPFFWDIQDDNIFNAGDVGVIRSNHKKNALPLYWVKDSCLFFPLLRKSLTRYEIGSDTPYTGVVIVHDGRSLTKANLYRGVPDGVAEEYNEYGTLRSRDFYKDGERLGSCDEPGCTDFE
jgi:hypothetical protein